MAPWDFKQELESFFDFPKQIYNRVKEGILRTPGKRKREPEPEAMQEERPTKRGQNEVDLLHLLPNCWSGRKHL